MLKMKHGELENKSIEELKEIIIGYQLMVDKLKKENELLKYELDNYDSLQAGKCCQCERKSIQNYIDVSINLMNIQDLIESLEDIAEDMTPRAFQNYILGEFSKEIKRMIKVDK